MVFYRFDGRQGVIIMVSFIVGVSTVICMLNGKQVEGVVKMEGPALIMIQTQVDIGLITIDKNKCVIKN